LDVAVQRHLQEVGGMYQNEGNFKLAEQHYVKAKDYKSAVSPCSQLASAFFLLLLSPCLPLPI
jgi:hypothetical protein